MATAAKKRVLILHTGGTFGKQQNDIQNGQENGVDYLSRLLKHVPELSAIAFVDLKILCNIDSSDASSQLWTWISKTIHEHWDQFDGCVVIHGTDTMAWTACAVSFLLKNLTKPIVFTGSQRPLAALRSDARINIIDAVELATHPIPEVMLCFDSKIHRASRVTKYSNTHLQAFKSPNASLLGEFGVHIKINPKAIRSIVPENMRTPPELQLEIDPNILILRCVPGMTMTQPFVDMIIASYHGLVVQGFGAGNLPLQDPTWQMLFQTALEKKCPVVMSTQCESGYVSLDLYENGRRFEALGAISAMDMTLEAAAIKLMIMLGRKIPFEKRQDFFTTALASECTFLSQQNTLDES